MSLADYNSMEAAMHLMRSPKNAARIDSGIQYLEEGKGITVKI
jgi:PHD/YefM family antitoxin component YafN of YafNO toxin-antitoxin module